MQIERTRQRIAWKPTLQIRYLLLMWCISFDLIFVQFSWFAFSFHSLHFLGLTPSRIKIGGEFRPIEKSLNLKKNGNSDHVMNSIYFSMITWYDFGVKTYSLAMRCVDFIQFFLWMLVMCETETQTFVLLWSVEIYGNASKNYRTHDADDGRRHEILYHFGENTNDMNIKSLRVQSSVIT